MRVIKMKLQELLLKLTSQRRKQLKVKTLKPFRDLKENIERKENDEFTVTKKRFEEITKKLPGYIEEVKEDGKQKSDD